MFFQMGAFGQGWWRYYLNDELKNSRNFGIVQNNGLFILGSTFESKTAYNLLKIDANGKIIHQNRTLEFAPRGIFFGLENKNFLFVIPPKIITDTISASANLPNLIHLDSNGIVLKTDTLPVNISLLNLERKNDSIFYSIKYRIDSAELVVFNINKKEIISKYGIEKLPYGYNSRNVHVISLKNIIGGYIFFLNDKDTLSRIVLDETGRKINKKIYPNIKGISSKIQMDSSENTYLLGQNTIVKINKNGNVVWQKQSPYYIEYQGEQRNVYNVDFRVLPNGDIVLLKAIKSSYNAHAELLKLNSAGDTIWNKTLISPFSETYLSPFSLTLTNNGSFNIVFYGYKGKPYPTIFQGLYILKIDGSGQIWSNSIVGKVQNDKNKNCEFDADDSALNFCHISATNENRLIYRGYTDNKGNYNIPCDTGRYIVNAITPNNLWANCTAAKSLQVSQSKLIDTVNFLLKAPVECPLLNVDISASFLRRCFENTYHVNYCNHGTLAAKNTYIEIKLDSLLEFVKSNQALASQNKNILKFDIGNLAIGKCGSFNITTRVRCGDSTALGQTLCSEAHIYPDSTCNFNANWSGANMVVTGTCQRDSVLFQIKNTGSAPSALRNSVVIEDEVLFLKGSVQLPQNGVFSKKLPANGKTWRMTIEQEPNHPTSANPTAFVEGCRANNNLPISTGFAPRFANDDRSLTIDLDCQQIVGAYDPNDKTGYPIGYKPEHFVAQNQDIEYLIRFQNTGTDTAFTVIIRDTISEKLDISSIELGASSHAYEFEIYGKGILKFTFNNIKLVDSFKNEAKSHGFIQYRVKQQKDLVFGTKIFNTAHIYFDFNEPVVTNKTLHTVGGKEVISAIIEKNNVPNVPLKVSPNPFTETTTFETPLSVGVPFDSILGDFELFDMTGKILRKEKFQGTAFEFHRKDLAAGVYIFKIRAEGQLLSVGKLVIQ